MVVSRHTRLRGSVYPTSVLKLTTNEVVGGWWGGVTGHVIPNQLCCTEGTISLAKPSKEANTDAGSVHSCASPPTQDGACQHSKIERFKIKGNVNQAF